MWKIEQERYQEHSRLQLVYKKSRYENPGVNK